MTTEAKPQTGEEYKIWEPLFVQTQTNKFQGFFKDKLEFLRTKINRRHSQPRAENPHPLFAPPPPAFPP